MSDYKLTLQSHNNDLQELINMANELPDKVEGVQLNFEVVGGTTEPSNPTENMIWVNTDVEIANYVFSVTQPTGYAGMVWIFTGTFSNASFNSLSENCIQIYPISAKQYVDDAWVTVTAKIYQNGSWNGLWDGSLYDHGNEYEDITGGWVFRPQLSSNASGVTVQMQENQMYMYDSYQYKALATTYQPIDLTEFNTLHIEGYFPENYDVGYYFIHPNEDNLNNAPMGGWLWPTDSLDISAINGKYYISIGTYNGHEVYYYKIYLR